MRLLSVLALLALLLVPAPVAADAPAYIVYIPYLAAPRIDADTTICMLAACGDVPPY